MPCVFSRFLFILILLTSPSAVHAAIVSFSFEAEQRRQFSTPIPGTTADELFNSASVSGAFSFNDSVAPSASDGLTFADYPTGFLVINESSVFDAARFEITTTVNDELNFFRLVGRDPRDASGTQEVFSLLFSGTTSISSIALPTNLSLTDFVLAVLTVSSNNTLTGESGLVGFDFTKLERASTPNEVPLPSSSILMLFGVIALSRFFKPKRQLSAA